MFTLRQLFLLITVCAVFASLTRLGGWELFVLVASLIPCGMIAFHVPQFWRTNFLLTAIAGWVFGALYGVLDCAVLNEVMFFGHHDVASYAFVATITSLSSVILAVYARRPVSKVDKHDA